MIPPQAQIALPMLSGWLQGTSDAEIESVLRLMHMILTTVIDGAD